MSEQPKDTQNNLQANNTSQATWEHAPTTCLPDNPPIMLVYDGLLGICYNRSEDICEIGYHSRAANHHPQIDVIAVRLEGEPRAESLLHLSWNRNEIPWTEFRLRLINPLPEHEAVDFYLPGRDAKTDEGSKDFRWLVDIEELHGNNTLEKQPGGFSPRLLIEQGTFYTLALTTDIYQIRPINEQPVSEREIAHLTAANLYCDPQDGKLQLELHNDQEGFTLEWSVQGRQIFVLVQNDCSLEDGKSCNDASDPDTDFELYYDALKPLPAGQKKHQVICRSQPRDPDFSHLNGKIRSALQKGGMIPPGLRVTDRAPCGRTGFGQSYTLSS